MCIPTTSVVAIRCPICGQLEFHALSLFEFAGSSSCKIQCTCGRPLLSIGTKDRKKFWLHVDCAMCETKHLFYFTRKQIWSDEVLEIDCEDTGLEIGYIGPKNKVRQCVQKQDRSLAEMAEELGFADYFDSPDIMYDVLDRLYQIAENGNLNCNCGNQNIEIEIFPDHLELRCDYCRSSARIMARTEEDLEYIMNSTAIQLAESGFDFTRLNKTRRRKKSKNSNMSNKK
ncbi:hypothetical protein [Zhaonella formicivorans]|uniref:hypothetical protein n=1 Tax=Zhaonella formicivorans TaxID=2528593 RepID=UPI0010D6B6B0|nr:hypothetical protein [Zhaonella formicivorans]